jgi:hypothetical protein
MRDEEHASSIAVMPSEVRRRNTFLPRRHGRSARAAIHPHIGEVRLAAYERAVPMGSIRKLVLLGLTALIFSALAASTASAVTWRAGSSVGATLAVNSKIHGCNSSGYAGPSRAMHCPASGTNFITLSVNGTAVKCVTTAAANGSDFEATIIANPGLGLNATARVDKLTFNNCTNSGGVPCNVVANGLPWMPKTLAGGGNLAGLMATSINSVSLGTGTTAGLTINGLNCLPNGLTCPSVLGGTAGTLGTAPDQISNYLTGTWVNPDAATSPPQWRLSGGVLIGGACTVQWTAKYCVMVGLLHARPDCDRDSPNAIETYVALGA